MKNIQGFFFSARTKKLEPITVFVEKKLYMSDSMNLVLNVATLGDTSVTLNRENLILLRDRINESLETL